MTIRPADYMIDLRGKQYLPVAPRIVMFREAHETWSIETEPVQLDKTALVKATILDETGRVIATAHKTVTDFRGGAFEKAETGAIGRALSSCGFGTIAAGDMDEGDEIADAPVAAPQPEQHFGEAIDAATSTIEALSLLPMIEANASNGPHLVNATAKAFRKAIENAASSSDIDDIRAAYKHSHANLGKHKETIIAAVTDAKTKLEELGQES